MSGTRVSLSVTSDSQETVTRAIESLARAMAGLALEGVEAFLSAGPDYVDQDDEP